MEKYMSMTKVLCGLAALPLLTGVAFAAPVQSNQSKALVKQPTQLSEQQMDKVTAGWDFLEIDIYNTGVSVVSVWQKAALTPANPVFPGTGPGGFNTIACGSCYLLINNPAISVASQFGR
jgi:hypothetical protein